MNEQRYVNGKLLRCGYTTGSCAAAAAKAATMTLLGSDSGQVAQVELMTPKGILLTLAVEQIERGADFARCAVRKDGGDDPDATSGLLIVATVRKSAGGVTIEGGEGVGRVTKSGLDQAVGSAAINHVPRQMIEGAVTGVCRDCGYAGGLKVTISVPGGAEVGRHTFNPYLGIEGGISVLGTTGIVEPMSSQALVDSIRVECNVLRQSGNRDGNLLITLGNYGDDFAHDQLGLDLSRRLKCANFIGEALNAAVAAGFTRALLIGHIGKMVKLGAGIMNTHSAQADARMDILCACALEAGASLPTLRGILRCATTDAALDVLDAAKILAPTMAVLGRRIEAHLERHWGGHLQLGAVVFSNSATRTGVLCECGDAQSLMKVWRHNSPQTKSATR